MQQAAQGAPHGGGAVRKVRQGTRAARVYDVLCLRRKNGEQ